MKDRRLKMQETAKAVGLTSDWEYHILTEELGMKKLSARWVPQLLTLDYKHTRVKKSAKFSLFSAQPKMFAPVCDHRLFVYDKELCELKCLMYILNASIIFLETCSLFRAILLFTFL